MTVRLKWKRTHRITNNNYEWFQALSKCRSTYGQGLTISIHRVLTERIDVGCGVQIGIDQVDEEALLSMDRQHKYNKAGVHDRISAVRTHAKKKQKQCKVSTLKVDWKIEDAKAAFNCATGEKVQCTKLTGQYSMAAQTELTWVDEGALAVRPEPVADD